MNYKKALSMAKEIERKHGKELKDTYAMISKKVSIKDFRNFAKNPKEISVFDDIDDELIKRISKIIAPILVIIGFTRAVHLTIQYFVRKSYDKPDKELIFQLLLATIWVSIIMSYFEKQKYINEVDDKTSDTYKLFHEAMENRKRFWRKLQSLQLFDLSIDLVTTSVKMSIKMFKWQIQLAKESKFYLILFMLNILINVLLVVNIIRYMVRR